MTAKLQLSLFFSFILWLHGANGQSWFWPPYKIRRCPEKLRAAEYFCRNEEPNYLCSCYLWNVFDGDTMDMNYVNVLLDEIEIDEKAENATAVEDLKIKKAEFIQAVKRALLRCHWSFRARIYPMIFKYRRCVFQTLERVCKAEVFHLPAAVPLYQPFNHPLWYYANKSLTRSSTVFPLWAFFHHRPPAITEMALSRGRQKKLQRIKDKIAKKAKKKCWLK